MNNLAACKMNTLSDTLHKGLQPVMEARSVRDPQRGPEKLQRSGLPLFTLQSLTL